MIPYGSSWKLMEAVIRRFGMFIFGFGLTSRASIDSAEPHESCTVGFRADGTSYPKTRCFIWKPPSVFRTSWGKPDLDLRNHSLWGDEW